MINMANVVGLIIGGFIALIVLALAGFAAVWLISGIMKVRNNMKKEGK